jgi:hypothetical protein
MTAMTPVEQFLDYILNFQLNIWLIAKIIVLFALGFYIAFTTLVVREVNLMTKTLKGIFDLPIRIIALVQLIFSILVFMLALVIL